MYFCRVHQIRIISDTDVSHQQFQLIPPVGRIEREDYKNIQERKKTEGQTTSDGLNRFFVFRPEGVDGNKSFFFD